MTTSDPKPDPKPFIYREGVFEVSRPANWREMRKSFPDLYRFAPRPEFSQNPADYGIEAPHE